jgi:hypothetical protein
MAKQRYLPYGDQEVKRNSGRGQGQVTSFKGIPQQPTPATRSHLSQFYHLPIVCSTFEWIKPLIRSEPS